MEDHPSIEVQVERPVVAQKLVNEDKALAESLDVACTCQMVVVSVSSCAGLKRSLRCERWVDIDEFDMASDSLVSIKAAQDRQVVIVI